MSDPFYGTSAGFKAYWSVRGDDAITLTDDVDVEAALLVSSGYLDSAFLSSFGGLKLGGRDQIREWPRTGVQDIYGYYVPSTSIPREVENATYECAIRQIRTPGIFFKDFSPSKYRSVSISGAVSVDFATGTAFDFQTQMPQVAAILYPILSGSSSGRFSSLSGGVARV